MDLTSTILLVLALYVVQLFLQETSRYGFDFAGIVGNRDNPPALSVTAARLERAKDNMREALPVFLGIALLLVARHAETASAQFGGMVFLIARVAYVPAYLSGIVMLRSVMWLAANLGVLIMAAALLQSG